MKRFAELLSVLLRREIVARTSGTALGALWMLLQPSLQVATLWFFLAGVLRVRYPGLAGGFAQYYLIGMLPWMMLSEILLRSLAVLQEYASIYERTAFPVALIPLLPLIVSGTIYTLIYTAIALWFGGLYGAFDGLLFMVFLLIWLLPLVYLGAILGVFVRDLQQLAPFALNMLLYLTPVLYTPSVLPPSLHWWLTINPFAHLMLLAHAAVDGTALPVRSLLALSALWLLLLYPAWALHRRAEPYIREAL